MSAGLAAGLIFLAALAGLILWAKPWKKSPETPSTRPGVPAEAPEPK